LGGNDRKDYGILVKSQTKRQTNSTENSVPIPTIIKVRKACHTARRVYECECFYPFLRGRNPVQADKPLKHSQCDTRPTVTFPAMEAGALLLLVCYNIMPLVDRHVCE